MGFGMRMVHKVLVYEKYLWQGEIKQTELSINNHFPGD